MGVKAPPSKILHVKAKKLLEAAVQMQLDLMYSWAMKMERAILRIITNLFQEGFKVILWKL